MRVGVMSDSHGDYGAIEQAVELAGTIDLWLHAGDLCSDAEYLADYSSVRVVSVAGNCDGLNAPSHVNEFIEIAGKKIWLTHGHYVRVKYGQEELIFLAKEYGVDAVIYGHTHIVDISCQGDLLVFNPGSVARPRYNKATFLILSIDHGEILSELIKLS